MAVGRPAGLKLKSENMFRGKFFFLKLRNTKWQEGDNKTAMFHKNAYGKRAKEVH